MYLNPLFWAFYVFGFIYPVSMTFPTTKMHFCCWSLLPVQACWSLLIPGWWEPPSPPAYFHSLFTFSTMFLIFIVSLLLHCLFPTIFWSYSTPPSIPPSATFWTPTGPFCFGISVAQSVGTNPDPTACCADAFRFTLNPFSVKPKPFLSSSLDTRRHSQESQLQPFSPECSSSFKSHHSMYPVQLLLCIYWHQASPFPSSNHFLYLHFV